MTQKFVTHNGNIYSQEELYLLFIKDMVLVKEYELWKTALIKKVVSEA